MWTGLVSTAARNASVSGAQPNPIFLRNWREALALPPERHHDTYDKYGNLFGAAIPINLDDAIANDKLAAGGLVALGGFSHAGDYSAAALVRWGHAEMSSPVGVCVCQLITMLKCHSQSVVCVCQLIRRQGGVSCVGH